MAPLGRLSKPASTPHGIPPGKNTFPGTSAHFPLSLDASARSVHFFNSFLLLSFPLLPAGSAVLPRSIRLFSKQRKKKQVKISYPAARNAIRIRESSLRHIPERKRRRLYPKEQSRKKQISKRGRSSKFSGHPVLFRQKFEKDAVSGHGKNSAAKRAKSPATSLLLSFRGTIHTAGNFGTYKSVFSLYSAFSLIHTDDATGRR